MRIAFIGEAVSGFGGMETVIRDVINHLQEKPFGHMCDMFFFCRNDKMDKAWLNNINFSCSFSNTRLGFLRRAKHINAFSQWLKETRPDVVICIDVLSCLFASKARKKSGVDFTLFSWPHFSLDHKKHAECVTCADYHLAISSGIKQQIMARGVPESAISVIYNPVKPKSAIIPAPEKNEPASFIYVGRMKFEGQKRVKDLLEGLSQVEGQWHLHMIGDGSDFEKCKAYGRELKIDEHITWYGWQEKPWEVVQQEIKKVSALLLTSSFEGFPMTLLEAMSYGIPCISSNCTSGPEDIIQSNVNGHMYQPGNVEEFVRLVNQYISGDIILSHDRIPSTIREFYSSTYFERLNKIVFSAVSRSK
ncbi:lipopolysaccharide 1,6-galactosyltransferase [Citrobacter rodentium]|uniref:Lipopolysaccharide 1,6-galactosyltransferase n=2 Tax=Citrobacter rodentium TaxID=67825 RepID=D2TIX5_CITRI|nr:lipopolysaccharide 1,6-galactosyltransferase [Citrobacter rodentium]KIQ50536.1 UDP-D-galactose:(glucosyl)lipopolysaccharide-1,6-D-galactosyltransferase [Citrobacter rodentium]QBY30477.1 lipopolysaccharide 1,6-galactosyltransferase [Citrobacter rodentium]UHO32152.1 lipopolysaccharide 1,6-galactosyltransferase [Citrobacter rodentium NBRC 105723 = DSM 16636]CBG90887.1 lipopolysaccharide 1,6-galactosyltransferase [Citrobacter rodentium ICC168]HAT8013125.1 glycosyl transferase [Citrobacter roden